MELALAARWRRDGDQAAANTLARAQLVLVMTIARKYSGYGIGTDELVAEGNFGLVRALQKFEPERGLRFGTYAAYWVRSSILDYILKSWSLVSRGGPLRSQMFFKLRRERSRAACVAGEGDRADALVAERLGVTTAQLKTMTQRLERRDVSLDGPSGIESTGLLEVLTVDDEEERLCQLQETRRVAALVRKAIAGLNPRERYIAEHRWMVDATEAMTLAEIGRHLGISREWARQVEERARAKVRSRIPEPQRLLGEEAGHRKPACRVPERPVT